MYDQDKKEKLDKKSENGFVFDKKFVGLFWFTSQGKKLV